MKLLVPALIVMSMLTGCQQQAAKMTADQMAREQDAVKVLAAKFESAYSAKDLGGLKSLIVTTGDFKMFGSDSAEVMRSEGDFETQAQNDWKLFDTAKFGEMRNEQIVVSDDGSVGSAVFESPLDVTIGGTPSHMLARLAITARKESGAWKIAQAMISMATVGQSSAEMVAKMAGGK